MKPTESGPFFPSVTGPEGAEPSTFSGRFNPFRVGGGGGMIRIHGFHPWLLKFYPFGIIPVIPGEGFRLEGHSPIDQNSRIWEVQLPAQLRSQVQLGNERKGRYAQ